MRVASHEMTAESLLGLDAPDKHIELVRGTLVVREPAGLRHGRIGAALAYRLRRHLEDEVAAGLVSAPRGTIFGPDTGFILARAPDTVRAPDVAFVCADRLPTPLPEGFGDRAPDLVVEVRSPSEATGAVVAKVAEYLAGGTTLVWVVDPQRSVVSVFAADGGVQELGLDATVSGDPVLPGFVLPVASILRG